MTADVDMSGAAALVHRSYSWFAKNWRTLRHPATGQPFPAPFIGAEPGRRPWWRRTAIEAWQDAAADTPRHLAQREPPTHADNDPVARPRTDRTAALLAAAGG